MQIDTISIYLKFSQGSNAPQSSLWLRRGQSPRTLRISFKEWSPIKLQPFWSFETFESTKNFLTSKNYLVGSRLEPLWSEFHGWSTTINNIYPWARDPTVPSSPSHNSFDRSIQNGGSQFFNDVVSAWCLVTRTIALIWPYTVRALYPRSLWSLEHSNHFTPRSACHCRRFGQVKLLTISIFPYLSISLKIWNGQAREPGELNLIPHHSRKNNTYESLTRGKHRLAAGLGLAKPNSNCGWSDLPKRSL